MMTQRILFGSRLRFEKHKILCARDARSGPGHAHLLKQSAGGPRVQRVPRQHPQSLDLAAAAVRHQRWGAVVDPAADVKWQNVELQVV